MKRQALNDRNLKSLKAAPKNTRYEVRDTVVPGLSMRVTDKGKKTFVFVGRFGGSKNPTRRALGEYGAITLEAARRKARGWIEMIQRGEDPKEAERKERLAAALASENTFAVVAEDFIQREVSKRRRAKDIERDIRKELIDRWADRPVTGITADDVMEMLDEIVDRGHKYQAFAVFAHVRRLFNWAIGRSKYGLKFSPCDRIMPKDAIGKKEHRHTILNDNEIRALWRALGRMEYPFAPLLKILLLTGQRKSEVGGTSWPEFDFKQNLWTIPPERMKGKAPHIVPLTPDVLDLLKPLPRFTKGDYVFSTTFGETPVSGYSRAKTRLDKLMLDELRKLAVERGDNPDKVKLTAWRLHDIRRTMRTHLSALPIRDMVRELVIAHAQPALHQVYDQHSYIDEKRQALELWAARLRGIVEPPPENVVPIKGARAAQ